MQLSSRILTAVAVLILAVAVVAVRGVSSGTLEAATGTIDVLNVGTCYTTNSDVFGAGDCDSGETDDEGDSVAYDVTGRDSVGQVGNVYATYSHDPKTAADDPRGILTNSDLIKISIQDTGRDKRTPVLLPVSNADGETAAGIQISADDLEVIMETFDNLDVQDQQQVDDVATTATNEAMFETPDRSNVDASTIIKHINTADPPVTTYNLAANMRWDDDTNNGNAVALTSGVKNGLRVIVTGGDDAPDYLPMDVSDNAEIRFFGCIEEGTPDNVCGEGEDFQDLTNGALRIDEDRGSGRAAGDIEDVGAVAPWLNVQVHNANVVLQYIVYHTSERETLVGGHPDNDYEEGVNLPDFTKSEGDNDTPLTVRVKSDGDMSTQNLWLYETGRFTGRYEGYVRLTDADGQGPDADSDTDGNQASNWGLQVQDATGPGDADAVAADPDATPAVEAMDAEPAIIGVESGPVTIEYRDTDGHMQTKSVMIDTVPPAIQIDTPAHNSRDQDTSPEFAGSFNDAGSGLRDDSFQLYVDNSNDGDENGTTGETALRGVELAHGVMDPGAEEVIGAIEDYTGYGDGAQFGVITHTTVYKSDTDAETANLLKVGSDNFSDGAGSGTFADSVRIRITEGEGEDEKEVDPYNNTIDYQAVVADIAGNIGFSDSDDSGPRFIADFGKKGSDRKSARYNVLGWYARHIFHLDEKDPEVYASQSVTGFYGTDDDDKPVVNRSGVLIAFDAAVDADSVDVGTFEVTLDAPDGGTATSASVTDVTVVGRQVYLLLSEELASDATPSVNIAAGESVSDPAGNRLTRGGLAGAKELNDGIAPKLQVLLRGGSGTGEGNEAPNKLTNKAMTITVVSDEEINNTPSIAVVCSNIAWDSDGDDDNDKSLSNFTGARSGPMDKASAAFEQPAFDCGDNAADRQVQQVQTFSRPGLEWEYQWENFEGDKEMPDGKLTVVAYGRDRQSYASLGEEDAADDTYNWGVATIEFNLDTEKPGADPTPGDGATVTDSRPFLLLLYDDKSTVSVSKLTFGGVDQTEHVQRLESKRFLYWPESLAIGTHEYTVQAVDAAGNKSDAQKFSFKVAERATFDIKLIAGWNAVSLPANPIDPEVGAVFTESIVDMIAAWDGESPEAPWSIATRMDGEWSTHSDFATLRRITARYGYWVHSQGFTTQSVALVGKGNREDPTTVPADLIEIPTNPGWNFVGVIDQDGDQTQDDYGESLMNGSEAIKASDYLGKHVRAYTWDAIRNRFDILEGGDSVTIGEGIWVYYGDGIAP